ncbi:MAG: HI0074 family nucleotidyltransferase substrate-binding subunit [Rhodanobacteraceae bacterium]
MALHMDDRFAVALEHFDRALARLKEALERPEDDIVRDAIIQRFEFTFETAWKVMYRWLRARGVDLDEDAFSTIPEAFKRRLVTDEKAWGEMRKFRNQTSHTYDESKAIAVAAFARAEAAALFDELLRVLRERAE